MRINHSLQGGSQERSGNSLATHIGKNDREALFGIDRIEEIPANFLAREGLPAQLGEGHVWNLHLHLTLLDARGDGQLLLVAAGRFPSSATRGGVGLCPMLLSRVLHM